MEIETAIKNALKDMILPELDKIKTDGAETRILLGAINERLDGTNKRIDDIQIQLSDMSRRIDDTNKRIDTAVEKLENKIDATNQRLDRLYEIIVRRDEHSTLEQKVLELERDIQKIKVKIAV